VASIFSMFGTIFIDNEKANKNIDTTTKKGNDMGNKVSAALSKIGKGAAIMGTAVATGAAAVGAAAYKMATRTAEQADTIDKLSERTGIHREELQRWMHAADQSDVSIESFSKGVKKMSEQLDRANEGSESARANFERVGLSLDDLNKMSLEQQFDAIASALADMEEGAERNALGNQLLGRSYVDMLPLLNAGSDGIKELKQEADELGMVMSEETVGAGVVLGDTIANVKDSFNGLINRVGAAAIPMIQKFADMIIAAVPTLVKIMDGLIPIITSIFENVLPPLFSLIEELFPQLVDLVMKLLPPISEIIKILLPVLIQLVQMILPPLMEILKILMPLVVNLLPPLLSLLQPILTLLEPLIQLLLQIITPLVELLNMILPPLITIISKVINIAIKPLKIAFEAVSGVLSGTVKAAFGYISNYVTTAKNVFKGLIDFIKNVFTGNWRGAWQAVKDIFSSVFNGIKGAFKLPINYIIDGINSFIRGINKIKIPEWVPSVGGKGFNIKQIPRLRVGIDYVPYDEFPALLHKGERVLTASENKSREVSQTVNVNVGDINIGSIDEKTDINALTNEIVDKIVHKIQRKKAVFG